MLSLCLPCDTGVAICSEGQGIQARIEQPGTIKTLLLSSVAEPTELLVSSTLSLKSNPCVCEDEWELPSWHPSCVNQSGCASPSCDGNYPWCIVANPGCDEEDLTTNTPWAYCNPDTDVDGDVIVMPCTAYVPRYVCEAFIQVSCMQAIAQQTAHPPHIAGEPVCAIKVYACVVQKKTGPHVLKDHA